MQNIDYLMNKLVGKYGLIFCLLVTISIPAFNQDSLVVRGKIMGGKDNPIKDVSVSMEGTDAVPVLSDQDGRFTLIVPRGNAWLIISPVREYKSKRVFLNNSEEVIIFLTENDLKSGYDEVHVINQTERRRDILTSFTDTDLDLVEHNNFITIDQSFQGEVPGILTVNQSGMPGQGAVSYLRGINSMNTSNAPLFIIDGMPLEKPGLFMSSIEGNSYNPLSTMEPSDISSITILKDPVATSVYGTKASNGVVLIQTLEATAIQTTINVSLKTGLNLSPNSYIHQLNSEQYKLLANEILVSSPKKLENFEDDYPGLYVQRGDEAYYRYIHNTNWQDLIFSNALFNNAYLSIKGGSAIATYGLSVGYHGQGGIVKNSRYNRYNFGFVSDLNVFPWFKMKVNANLTNNNSYLMESGLSPQTNPITASLLKPPIMDPYQYDDKGQELSMLDDVDELGTSNPLAVVNNFIGENKNYRFISSINGVAELAESLKLNTMLGINFNTMKEFVFMPNKGIDRYYNGEAHNVSQSTNNYLFSFYTDNFLNYRKQFHRIHDFSASLGFRVYSNTLEIDFGEALNLPENDQYTNLQSGQNELKNIGGNNDKWNWLSVYNQLTYKFKDKYIVNTGLSTDFSTRTGAEAPTALKIHDEPFGLFYSFGVGWRVSEERFFNQLPGLDNLMLRASYGITGNDDIGNYNALDYYMLSLYRETSGLVPSVIANKSLKYEQINQLNGGIDLSLRGNKTSLHVDFYKKTTKNMFIYEPLESYYGFDYRPANIGNVENKGWEFSLFHRLIDGLRFTWDLSATLSFVSNNVKDFAGEELVTSFPGGQFITREGDPVNSFYGYQFEGVYTTNEEAELADLVNERSIPFGAGDAIYQDVSGPENEPDGMINDYDKKILGSPTPEYYGSIINSFTYNRWSLNIMFQFVYGNEVFNYTRYLNERMVDLSNQSSHVLNRWQFEGDRTDVPRALWNDPVGNSDFSSRWIEDGSYLRLKALTLRYFVPEKFIFFRNAEFYVTATNLLTFDHYLGYDPEFSYSSSPMQQGIDYGLMPQSRQFMIGFRFGL